MGTMNQGPPMTEETCQQLKRSETPKEKSKIQGVNESCWGKAGFVSCIKELNKAGIARVAV